MKSKVVAIIILLVVISAFLFGCNTPGPPSKYENPECQTDLDCKNFGALGGQCINNHCQLNSEPTSPPVLPEE